MSGMTGWWAISRKTCPPISHSPLNILNLCLAATYCVWKTWKLNILYYIIGSLRRSRLSFLSAQVTCVSQEHYDEQYLYALRTSQICPFETIPSPGLVPWSRSESCFNTYSLARRKHHCISLFVSPLTCFP